MDFAIILNSSPEKIFKILIDFEGIPKFLPRQLKEVNIIKKENEIVHTKEKLVFKTIVKNKINQECIHKIGNNKITTEIISGPAKNSTINLVLNKQGTGTKVDIVINLKLSLKAKILLPIIKKVYRALLTGILYKIDNLIMEQK